MIDAVKFKKKKKEVDVEGSSEVRKRRMPPGHIPFRRIKIPEQWKKDMIVVEKCVSDAFTSCTYPSLEKKERLRSAVLDVFTETRTMKESSIFYNVPFTTVQTYFHKSCKLVEEAIPFDDGLRVEDRAKVKTTKQSNTIGDVLQRLSGIKSDAISPEIPVSVSISPHLSGSSKRKPKFVRRIVSSEELEDDAGEESLFDFELDTPFPFDAFNCQQVLMLTDLASMANPLVNSGSLQGIEMSIDGDVDVSVVPDWCREKLVAYIASVSGVCEEIRCRLKAAINDVYAGKMSLQDACLTHNLGFNYLSNYYEAFLTQLRKQAAFIMSVLSGGSVDEISNTLGLGDSSRFLDEAVIRSAESFEKMKELVSFEKKEDALRGTSDKVLENGREGSQKRHREREKYGPPLDPEDSERLKAIEQGVIEACKPSTYNESQKKRLHMAVSMVVRGEGPVSVAANQSHLPPSTVQLYAQRTRIALGSLLPPPAASVRRSLVSHELNRPWAEKSVGSEKNWDKELKRQSPGDSLELNENQDSDTRKSFVANRDDSNSYFELKDIQQRADSLGTSALSDLAVRMLAKVDVTTVLSSELKCTKEELIRKIDAILRNFHYPNDCTVMRDALVGIFLEGKTVDEVCHLNKLKVQEVGAYMALVKVYCESKKQEYQRDIDIELNEAQSQGCDSPRKKMRRSTSSLRSSGDLTLLNNDEPGLTHSSEASLKSREGSSESRVQGHESGSLVDKVDVMFLHSETVLNSEELCMKSVIAYLVQQQYRRSQISQDKLRLCLENVLLDGLQLKETLMLFKGLSEHVIQAYVIRCRDAKNCITNEFPIFISESLKALNEVDFANLCSDDSFVSATQKSDTSTTSSSTSCSRTQRKMKKNALSPDSKVIQIDSVARLNLVLTEEVLEPLRTYIKKLNAINFPIDDTLKESLAKVILQNTPSPYILDVSDDVWSKWGDSYNERKL
ncbi:unnamed protein product [Enterobius vermicularis]|uniref:HTH psq-type domain-containing protein n=1 Tax=Enterobius vermicularis TaxID=51028 RepID=A0A0N4VEB6_ENTVE|nr:unnamed protein product [Enterobius vermicularis]